jgi:hypothetical protein
MKAVFKKSVAAVATVVGLVGMSGCSNPQDHGYVPVTADDLAKMPKEPMTAVLNSKSDGRVSIEVDGPMGCYTAATESDKTRDWIYRDDNYANCHSRNGTIPVVIIDGQPHVRGKLVTPILTPTSQ